jgi:hypothetical protein
MPNKRAPPAKIYIPDAYSENHIIIYNSRLSMKLNKG